MSVSCSTFVRSILFFLPDSKYTDGFSVLYVTFRLVQLTNNFYTKIFCVILSFKDVLLWVLQVLHSVLMNYISWSFYPG